MFDTPYRLSWYRCRFHEGIVDSFHLSSLQHHLKENVSEKYIAIRDKQSCLSLLFQQKSDTQPALNVHGTISCWYHRQRNYTIIPVIDLYPKATKSYGIYLTFSGKCAKSKHASSVQNQTFMRLHGDFHPDGRVWLSPENPIKRTLSSIH